MATTKSEESSSKRSELPLTSETKPKSEPLVDVGALVGTPRANQIATMSNGDLGAEAQAISIQIADLSRTYSGKSLDLDYDEKMPAIERVRKKAELEKSLDGEFRARFANDVLLFQRELSNRAVAANKPLADIGAIKIPQRFLSSSQIRWIGIYLGNWGQEVQALGEQGR